MPDAGALVSGLSNPVPPAITIPNTDDPRVSGFLKGFSDGMAGRPASVSSAPSPASAPSASPITPEAAANADVNKLYAMVLPREGSDDHSISPAGAIGKGQVLPSTAIPYLFPGHDPSDPKVQAAAKQALLNPKTNEMVSKTYLSTLNKRYSGDTEAVLVAYNAGPTVADKWLAAGKDPSVLPAETQHYIGEPLSAQWGKLTPQEQALMRERQAVTDNTVQSLTGMMQRYAQEAAQAPAGSQERDAMISRYRENLDQMQHEWRQKVASPPVEKPTDLWAAFGSPAMVLSLFAGLLSKQHITAALGAGGAVLNAIHENDREAYERNYRVWKDHLGLGLQMISMENQDIRAILEDQRMALDQKNMRLQTLAAEMGFMKGVAGMQLDSVDAGWKFLEDREKAAQAAQTHADQIQMHYDSMNLVHQDRVAGLNLRAQNPQTAAFQQFLAEHPNATSEEMQQYLQRSRPARSGPAAAVQKYLAENPDASAEDVSRFVAHVRAEGAAEQAFESGAQGNTVRSINVAMDHTDTLLQLGEALQNGDTRRLNQLKNVIKSEFGYEGPVDFNFAKQIVGDEIVKAVIGNGAGTGEDRRGLQAAFDAANSPRQLVGVIRTADALLGGQLQGLRRQYQGAGLTDFDAKLSPKAKTRLSGGVPNDLPSPAGHAEGSVAKDASGRVVAKIVGGQWAAP